MINVREYFRAHAWLIYHFGKANKCESDKCVSHSPKRYEWALIKGKEAIKERGNYIMLCPSCHRKYDFTEAQRQKISISKKGKPAKNKLMVSKFSLCGKFIERFNSFTEAARSVGGATPAFTALKKGRLKTYKSFLWEF